MTDQWPAARFMDGTPVPAEYLAQLQPLLDGAAAAEEQFTLDELEQFAEAERGKRGKAG